MQKLRHRRNEMVQLIIQHQSKTITCIMNMAHLQSHSVKEFLELIKKINSNQCCSIYLPVLINWIQQKVVVMTSVKLNTSAKAYLRLNI